ncbi:MAG TPA: hypothetical protein VFY10_16505 [Dehalococcoidia bacterium]|nr:hypothetical protein [Dehalococcoidia bacterium]
MQKKRGPWWLLFAGNIPFLFLARTGLLGDQAREEAQVALEDWAGYGRIVLPLFAVLGVVVVAALTYALIH